MAQIPFARRMRGLKARNQGSQFETMLVLQARMQGIGCFQMPLGAKRINGRYCPACKRKSDLMQVQTHYDWELIYRGVVVKVDCKTIESGKFSYSMILPHQVEGMADRQGHGVQGGYIIWFRDVDAVIFFNVEKLAKVQPKSSLNPEDGVYLGTSESFALGNLFL